MKKQSKVFLVLFLALLLLLAVIAVLTYRQAGDGAEIIEHAPDEIELRFWTHSWQLPFGVHGGRSFKSTDPYEAALIGTGPTYTNPVFLDISSDSYYGGTITLDLPHNHVMVDMHRVVSRHEDLEQSRAFLANGVYVVKSVRKGLPLEQKIFKEWLTNSVK